MTAQEAESVKVEDRVRSAARTGIIDLVVLDIFVIKWDGRRDSEAYTRDAVEKLFTGSAIRQLL
jgi:hypothetical protein